MNFGRAIGIIRVRAGADSGRLHDGVNLVADYAGVRSADLSDLYLRWARGSVYSHTCGIISAFA